MSEPLYLCPRCGLQTNLRGNMRHHLSRKTPCRPIDEEHDISLDEYKNEICKSKEALLKCDKCDKSYVSKTSLKYHICRPKNVAMLNMLNTLSSIKQIQKELETIAQQIKKDYNIHSGVEGGSETGTVAG